MRWFSRWYGAGPLHLLALLGCFALAGYAAAELLPNNAVGIPVWLVGAVIGHDLLLMPLYTIADRSAMAVFRHRRPRPSAVPWINYLRVPVVLSGLLLLIWFPLIFRLPSRFPATTTLSLDPYLWHWLAVTGALFLLSATALALRLGAVRRGTRKGRTSGRGVAVPASDVTPGHPERPGPARHDGPAGEGKTSPGRDAHVLKGVAPPALRDPTTPSGRSPGMTSPSTITERVAEMHAAMAAEPPSEAMGPFAREQAGLAASVPGRHRPGGDRAARRGAPRRARRGHDAVRRSRGRHVGPGLLPGSLVPVLQHRPVRLPGPVASAADGTRHPAPRDQPAEAGRFADHAAEAQPGLHCGLRPGQHDRRPPRHPHAAIGRGPCRPAGSSDST